MIKTRSPYYIEVPYVSATTGVTCYAFILKLYVWQGNKYDAPTDATWEQTIENPEGLTDNRKINVSPLINSYIDFETQSSTTGLVDGINQLWVKASVTYQQTSDLDYETEQDIFIQLAVRGYADGMGGENQDTPDDKVLLTGRTFKVNKGGKFVIPLEMDTPTAPTPSITITNITDNTGGSFTFTYTTVGTYAELGFGMKLETTSYPAVYSTDVDGDTTITVPDLAWFDAQIIGFDLDTGVSVSSNIYTL